VRIVHRDQLVVSGMLFVLLLCGSVSAQELSLRGGKGIIPEGAQLETLWEEGGFTEGAAAGPDGLMYFSDFAQPFDARPARVMKFNPATGATEIHAPDSKMSNGLMFDRQGRLIACTASPLGGQRALVEIKADGSVSPIVETYEGKRFNSPNDLVIHPGGSVYFTDPKYVGPEKMELESFDVYRLDPEGTLTRLETGVSKPNGIILSQDARTIFIAETDNGTAEAESNPDAVRGRMTLNAFRLGKDGMPGRKRVIVNFGDQLGIDGMTMDTAGHLYAAVRSEETFGIYIFTQRGRELGYIQTPELPTNCCFGKGKEARTLYITAGAGFYRIRLTATGYHPAVAE
jgi:gluconolactonase